MGLKPLPQSHLWYGLVAVVIGGAALIFTADAIFFSPRNPGVGARILLISMLLVSPFAVVFGGYLLTLFANEVWHRYSSTYHRRPFPTLRPILRSRYYAKAIRFKCGECGAAMEVPTEAAERRAECVECKIRQPVPEELKPPRRRPPSWRNEIAFRCPECRDPLIASSEALGKVAECASCRAIVAVPETAYALARPGPTRRPKPQGGSQPVIQPTVTLDVLITGEF